MAWRLQSERCDRLQSFAGGAAAPLAEPGDGRRDRNTYYCQTLLPQIAAEWRISAAQVVLLPALSQWGLSLLLLRLGVVSLPLLVLGIAALELAVQGRFAAHQTQILSLDPGARNRLLTWLGCCAPTWERRCCVRCC